MYLCAFFSATLLLLLYYVLWQSSQAFSVVNENFVSFILALCPVPRLYNSLKLIQVVSMQRKARNSRSTQNSNSHPVKKNALIRFRSIAFRRLWQFIWFAHVMIISMRHMGAFDRKTLFANRKHTTIEMTTTKVIILRKMKTNTDEQTK